MARATDNSLSGSRQDVPFNSRIFADISVATGHVANNGLDVGTACQVARSAFSQLTDCRCDSRRKHPTNRDRFMTMK